MHVRETQLRESYQQMVSENTRLEVSVSEKQEEIRVRMMKASG